MTAKYLLLPLIGITAMLSSCMVDQYGNIIPAGPVYAPGYYGPGYYGPYGYYGYYRPYGYYGPYGYGGFYGDPFFWFGGIYYYNYHGRYCYYDHGHRVFVSHLPSGGHGPVCGGSHYPPQGQHYPGSGGVAGTPHGAETNAYRPANVTTDTNHGSSGEWSLREHR